MLEMIRRLIDEGRWEASLHAVRELASDGLVIEPLVLGIKAATSVEEYPDYHKGPCVLILQMDESGSAIHILWGVPKGKDGPAVMVTAYRPDPEKWSDDFLARRPTG